MNYSPLLSLAKPIAPNLNFYTHFSYFFALLLGKSGANDNIMRMDFRANKEALSIVHTILIYHGEKAWEKKRRYDHFEPYLADDLLA